MVKKKAITKVLSCLVLFAILVSVMPVPIFAMNGSNNATEASNHSRDLEKSFILPLVSNDTRETVSALSCDVYVKIDDDTCVGYEVYVDGVYQFTEGQSGTPDGYCAFYVSAGTHKFELRKNGCTTSKSWYCQCGTVYIWVSMPDNWCEGGNHGEVRENEIKFTGTAIKYYESHSQFHYWVVRVDKIISGPQPCKDQLDVCIWDYEIPDPWGSVDQNLKEGDQVEVYGTYYEYDGICSASLYGSTDYYIKKRGDIVCEVYVIIDDDTCVGYDVYVDGVYKFTEGQSGTPDGYCAFYVTPGTHKFELRKNGCSVSKSWYCQCGTYYSWVSMNDMDPHWCDSHQQKKEVTFSGIVTGTSPEGLFGAGHWYVDVDEWISGSLPCDEIDVAIGIYPPMGSCDEDINKGDNVEAYGVVDPWGGSECTVGLNGESYYIKKIETCGKILEYAISDGTYPLPMTVMAHMKYKNYMKSPTKFKGVFLVRNQRTGKIYSCGKEQITHIDDRFGYGKGNSLQIRFEDEVEDIGVYDAKLELRNFYTDELCDETKWLEDQFKIDDGEEIKFNGTAIEYQRLIDTCYWTVAIDNVISGPPPSTNQLNVITWSSDPGIPRGYVDPNIKEGDKVEVYGEYRGDGPLVLLEGSEDYYIKILSYCTTKIVTLHEGEVLDFKTGEVFKNGEQPWSEYQMGFSGNEIWGECTDFVDMGIVDICSSEPPPHSLKTYNIHHITPEVGHTYGVALGCPVKECIQIYIQACDGNSVTFEYEVEPAGLLVHNINTGNDFATIQAAIDDSDTSLGDTITVDPGTYNENVDVTKSLTIKSTSGNPKDTIVQAQNSGDPVFEVTADDVTISGFTVDGGLGSNGIYLNSVKNCEIPNNNCSGHWAIVLGDSSNNVIISNNCSNNDVGISLWNSNNNALTGNNVTGNYIGIEIGSSSSNILTENMLLKNNWNGVYLQGTSSNNELYHNNFISNSASDIGTLNQWDNGYPSGGNYWSDYEEKYPDAKEIDESGIWDIPYDISGGAKDNYPLMEPLGEKQLPSSIYPIYDYINIDLLNEIGFNDIKLYVGPNINSVHIKELDADFQPDEQGLITLNHLHIYKILANGYITTTLDINGEEKKIDLLFSIDHLTDDEKKVFLEEHKDITGFYQFDSWEGEYVIHNDGDILKGTPRTELIINWKAEGQEIANFYSGIDEMLRILQFSYLLSFDSDVKGYIKGEIAKGEGKLTDDCEIYNEIRQVMETMDVPVFSKENPDKCVVEIPDVKVTETYSIFGVDTITNTDDYLVDETISLWITVDNTDSLYDPGGVILHIQTNVYDLNTASGLIKMALEAEEISVDLMLDVISVAILLATIEAGGSGGAVADTILDIAGSLNELIGLLAKYGISIISVFWDYSVDLSIPIIQEIDPEPISNDKDLEALTDDLFHDIDNVYFPLVRIDDAKGIIKTHKDILESNPVAQPIVNQLNIIYSLSETDLNDHTISLHFDSLVNPIEYDRVITDIYQNVNFDASYNLEFEYDIGGITGTIEDGGTWNLINERLYYPESYLLKVEGFSVSDYIGKMKGCADVVVQFMIDLAAKIAANIIKFIDIIPATDTVAKKITESIVKKLLANFASEIVEWVAGFVFTTSYNAILSLFDNAVRELIPSETINADFYMLTAPETQIIGQPPIYIVPAPSNLFKIDYNIPISFEETESFTLIGQELASFTIQFSSDFKLNMEEGGTLDDSNLLLIFARELLELSNSGSLTVTADGPVDIAVRNPDGLIFSKDSGPFSGCIYKEEDLDGEIEDELIIKGGKYGLYEISIIPETEANPNEFFSLSVSSKGDTITLAENVKISKIPDEPYSIELTDTGVIDKELEEKIARKYMPTIYQLQCDIADPKDNGLIKVGYSIEENNDEARIKYNLVFKDEDDAYLDTPYDEFRKLKYGRIEDIEGFSTTVDLNMDKIKEIEFDGTWHNDWEYYDPEISFHNLPIDIFGDTRTFTDTSDFTVSNGHLDLYIGTWNHFFSNTADIQGIPCNDWEKVADYCLSDEKFVSKDRKELEDEYKG